MQTRFRPAVLLLSCLALTLLLTGCPKRPVATVASVKKTAEIAPARAGEKEEREKLQTPASAKTGLVHYG